MGGSRGSAGGAEGEGGAASPRAGAAERAQSRSPGLVARAQAQGDGPAAGRWHEVIRGCVGMAAATPGGERARRQEQRAGRMHDAIEAELRKERVRGDMVADVSAGAVKELEVLSTETLATWAADGTVVVWDSRSGAALLALARGEVEAMGGGGVDLVVSGGDERSLLLQCRDDVVRRWLWREGHVEVLKGARRVFHGKGHCGVIGDTWLRVAPHGPAARPDARCQFWCPWKRGLVSVRRYTLHDPVGDLDRYAAVYDDGSVLVLRPWAERLQNLDALTEPI